MIFRKTAIIIYLFIFLSLISSQVLAENNKDYPFKLEDYLPENTEYATLNYHEAIEKEETIPEDELSYFIAKTLTHLEQKLGGSKSEKENFSFNHKSDINI